MMQSGTPEMFVYRNYDRARKKLSMLHGKKISELSKLLEYGILSNISIMYDDNLFVKRIVSSVNVVTHIPIMSNVNIAQHETNDNKHQDVSFIGTKDRHASVMAEEVARKFRCGIKTAKQTFKTTTQSGVRHAIHPLHRRYRVDHHHLNQCRLNDTFYMDTLFSRVKSLNCKKFAQIYSNGKYTRVYPMDSTSSANIVNTITDFTDDVSIPDMLICDLATEQVGLHTPMMQEIWRLKIRMHNSEKGRSNQNHKVETKSVS
jgi:hypothetical protein